MKTIYMWMLGLGGFVALAIWWIYYCRIDYVFTMPVAGYTSSTLKARLGDSVLQIKVWIPSSNSWRSFPPVAGDTSLNIGDMVGVISQGGIGIIPIIFKQL